MQNFDPQSFPLLTSLVAAKSLLRADQLKDGLQAVKHAFEHGGMRKVVYDDLKHMLSRMVDESWKKHVSEPFFYGQGDIENKEAQELYWSISVMSLHDMLSTKKKVDRTKATGPEVDAMKALATEVFPLATAMAAIKLTVVKGRAAPDPAKAAAEANPDKIVKTCPCCFRQIALSGQTMAHHGYQRPGHGYQTGSCIGIRFKPLEVSAEGLKYIMNIENERIVVSQKALEEVPGRTEIIEVNWRTKKTVTITSKEGPAFKVAVARLVRELEAEIEGSKCHLRYLEERMSKWVQTEPDELSSVRKSSKKSKTVST